MKLKIIFAIILVPIVVFSCAHKGMKSSASASEFGEKFDTTGAKNINAFIEGQDSLARTGVVVGRIASVCQAMGCWTTLQLADGSSVFVDFNHKFFLPKDAAGRTAYFNGESKVVTVSVAKQKHLAEDAGKGEAEIEAITKEKIEVQFKAKGAVLK